MNVEKIKQKVISFFKNDPKNAIVVAAGIFVLLVILLSVTKQNNPLHGTWTDGNNVMIFQNSGIMRDGFSTNLSKYKFKDNKLTIEDSAGNRNTFSAKISDSELTLTDAKGISNVFSRVSLSVDPSQSTLTDMVKEYRTKYIRGTWVWDDGYLQIADVNKCNLSGSFFKYDFDGSILKLTSDGKEMIFNLDIVGAGKIKLTIQPGGNELLCTKVSGKWDISTDEIISLYTK